MGRGSIYLFRFFLWVMAVEFCQCNACFGNLYPKAPNPSCQLLVAQKSCTQQPWVAFFGKRCLYQRTMREKGTGRPAICGREVLNPAPLEYRQFSKTRVAVKVLLVWVPYYFGDLNRDSNVYDP